MYMLKTPLHPTSLFLFLWMFFSDALSAQSNDGWVLKNEKEAVKVYYRKTSSIYELKLTTSIKVPLSGVVRLFDEVDHYATWGYKIAEARLLKRNSPTDFIYYTRIDFPWPLSDRDVVMHAKVEQDAKSNAVTSVSTALSGWVPEQKNLVRMKTVNTKWTLIPGKGGWLYVEYYLYSDPGGNLPDWAVNMALDVGPRETIKRMKDILKEPDYQNTKLAHIKE